MPGGLRTIGLTATEPSPEGPVARYRVSDDLAQLALRAPECRLVLIGTLVSMPRDLSSPGPGRPRRPRRTPGPRRRCTSASAASRNAGGYRIVRGTFP